MSYIPLGQGVATLPGFAPLPGAPRSATDIATDALATSFVPTKKFVPPPTKGKGKGKKKGKPESKPMFKSGFMDKYGTLVIVGGVGLVGLLAYSAMRR